MGKIFCLASPKGGSGKTILTATFGAFLAAMQKKVIMIDFDIATNGLTLMYIKEVSRHAELLINKNEKALGFFDVFSSDNETQNKLSPDIITLDNKVEMIPATYNFKFDKTVQDNIVIDPDFFEELKKKYDYIFIDAQAGDDKISRISIGKSLSDEVIIVSEYDPLSAAGVERMKGVLHEDLTYNRTWILINKILPEFVNNSTELLEVARYLNPIPWDASVVRACVRRKLALDLEKGNEYTLAIMQTLRTLLGEKFEKELNSWTEEHASIIRQPIKDQIQVTEDELKGLLLQSEKINRKIEKRKRMIQIVSIETVLMVPVILYLFFFKQEDYFMKIIGINTKEFLPIAIASALAVLAGIAGIVSFSFKRVLGQNVELSWESNKIKRQKEILEDKLKKLETLKDASFDTLVRKKNL